MRVLSTFLLLASTVAFAQTPPASVLFDKDSVHEIRLTFAQSDFWQQLTTNYEQNEDDVPYISASLVWGEYKFDSVGVRFKGNSSYNGATTKKKPFRIKLNEFVKGQKIDGMASFSLSNAWNDPSFVREKAYYDMAAAIGMPAPRSGFAALYINDEYYGLYVLTEVVNGDFLKSFFGKGNDGGNLYKADIGASFSYLGEDVTPYKNFFEKQSNEEADDWTDLIELSRIIGETPAEELPAKLEPLMDIDSVLTALALDNLTVNLDSYVSMGQNFYIYRRPSDNRWVWIPWDPSLAFGGLAQGLSTQQMKELTLEWTGGMGGGGVAPGAGGGAVGGLGGGAARPLASKLWQVPAYKQRYREIYSKIVDAAFVPATLVARMNALRDMIRPFVEKDTQKLVTQAQFDNAMTADGSLSNPGAAPGGARPGGGAMGGAPGLQPFIEGRLIAVKAQLAGQTPLSVSAAPTSLTFAVVGGAAAPAAQNITLAVSDGSKSLPYSVATSAAWLKVAAANGTAPGTIAVSVNPSGLAQGTFNGAMIVTVPGTTNTPISVPVTLIVTASPSLIATPSTVTISGFGGGFPGNPGAPGGTTGNSAPVQVVSTAGATPFTAAVATTSCGNFLTVAPTSGTTPATLTVTASPSSGTTGSCAGTLSFTASGMPTLTVPVNYTVGGGQAAPSIAAIVNAASFAAGAIAPGEMVTIYGANLGFRGGQAPGGGAPVGAPGGAVPQNPVQVLFEGAPATIINSAANQITAVVPAEVASKSQTSVTVSAFGQRSEPVTQSVTPTAPGVFTLLSSGSGQASALNESGQVNGTGTPARRGSTVSVFLTGAGATDVSGKVLAPVAATVGGQTAVVSFAGTAQVGLYRFDVVIPQTTASGAAEVRFTVGGVASQGQVTLSVE